MPDYEAVIKELQKMNQSLNNRLGKTIETNRKWKEKCQILLEANATLEKKIKAVKRSEAQRLAGFLRLGSEPDPIIDRDYKEKK